MPTPTELPPDEYAGLTVEQQQSGLYACRASSTPVNESKPAIDYSSLTGLERKHLPAVVRGGGGGGSMHSWGRAVDVNSHSNFSQAVVEGLSDIQRQLNEYQPVFGQLKAEVSETDTKTRPEPDAGPPPEPDYLQQHDWVPLKVEAGWRCGAPRVKHDREHTGPVCGGCGSIVYRIEVEREFGGRAEARIAAPFCDIILARRKKKLAEQRAAANLIEYKDLVTHTERVHGHLTPTD